MTVRPIIVAAIFLHAAGCSDGEPVDRQAIDARCGSHGGAAVVRCNVHDRHDLRAPHVFVHLYSILPDGTVFRTFPNDPDRPDPSSGSAVAYSIFVYLYNSSAPQWGEEYAFRSTDNSNVISCGVIHPVRLQSKWTMAVDGAPFFFSAPTATTISVAEMSWAVINDKNGMPYYDSDVLRIVAPWWIDPSVSVTHVFKSSYVENAYFGIEMTVATDSYVPDATAPPYKATLEYDLSAALPITVPVTPEFLAACKPE